MQKLIVQLQKLCAALGGILVILTACNAALKVVVGGQNYSKMSAAANEAFAGTTPEQAFARFDNSSDSKPYATLFDRLESKCFNTRNELGLMVHTVNKQNRKAGMTEPYLETLKAYVFEADTAFERKQGNCMEVYNYLKPEQQS